MNDDTKRPDDEFENRSLPLFQMSRFSDKSKPFLVVLSVLVILVVFDCLSSMPSVRASLYPISVLLNDSEEVVSKNHPLSFTEKEKPSFLFSCNCGHFYEFKLYRKEVFLDTPDKIAFKLNPVIELTPGQLNELPPDSIFASSGFLIPRNEKTAEIRIVVDETLSAGDYIGIFRTRSIFGKYEFTRPVFFRVTNVGAVVKRDPVKAFVLAVDLMTNQVVRDANVEIYKGSEPDDLIKLTSGVTDEDGFFEFDELKGVDEPLSVTVSKDTQRGFVSQISASRFSKYAPQVVWSLASYGGLFEGTEGIEIEGVIKSDKAVQARISKLDPRKKPLLLVSQEGIELYEAVVAHPESKEALIDMKPPQGADEKLRLVALVVQDSHVPLLANTKLAGSPSQPAVETFVSFGRYEQPDYTDYPFFDDNGFHLFSWLFKSK